MTWNEQLRDAIRKSGLTVYRVSLDAAIKTSVVQRFMTEKGGVTLDTAEKLAGVIGMSFHPTAPPPKGKRLKTEVK